MSYILSPMPKLQAIDANGNPLANGTLWTYVAGTDTPLATYSDSTGTVPNANPITLDTQGMASVWIDDSKSYKYVLKDISADIIYTVDNINSTSSGTILNVLNIAALRLIEGASNQRVSVSGYYTVNDGGGGEFYWNSADTTTEDNGMVIQATGITTGRWLRIGTGYIDVKWFGAKGDNSTNNSSVFTLANTYAAANSFPLIVKSGTYVLTTDPGLTVRVKLEPNAILKWATNTIAVRAIIDSGDYTQHFSLSSGGLVTLDCVDIYPEWFGATGTGIFTDNTTGTVDTVAIQATINSAQVGQYVTFRSNKKYITGNLTAKAGVNLKGSQSFENEVNSTAASEYSANIQFNGSSGAVIDLQNSLSGGLRGITIKDLIIDGGGTADYVLRLQTVGSMVQNCTLRNPTLADGYGIYFAGTSDSSRNKVLGCNFRNCNWGISNEGAGSINGIVADCNFVNCAYGVANVITTGWIVANNVINGVCYGQQYDTHMYGKVEIGENGYIGAIDTSSQTAIYKSAILAAPSGSIQLLTTQGGWSKADATFTTTTNVWNRKYLTRPDGGITSYLGARIHDSLGIDGANTTPRTDTIAWHERDMNGNQYWGNGATEAINLTSSGAFNCSVKFLGGSVGSNIAAASSLDITSNYHIVTGTDSINYIITTGWKIGSIITLTFTGATSIYHHANSVPANYAAIHIVDYTNDSKAYLYIDTDDITYQFIYDGTYWRMIGVSTAMTA